MKSRKWLKNFNPVSKKSGERHFDPLQTFVTVRYSDSRLCAFAWSADPLRGTGDPMRKPTNVGDITMDSGRHSALTLPQDICTASPLDAAYRG
jgi:hypothetical protein